MYKNILCPKVSVLSLHSVVLVPVAWLLSKISLGAVWFCFPISEFISLIVTVVFFVILYNKEIKNLDKPVNGAVATESVKG